MRTRDLLRQLANAVGIPLGIALSVLPFGGGGNSGDTAGEGTPTAVDAAAYAFAIWGLIFAWQVAYGVYQLLPAQRENATLRRVGWFTAANGFGNALWAVAVLNRQTALAAAILVVVMLGALVATETRFRAPFPAPGGRDFWLVRVPYSINLGWISVAAIISIAGVLRDAGWNGAPLSPEMWAAMVTIVAAGLGVAMLLTRGNVAYAAVIVWALAAVAIRQSGVPVVPLVAVIGAGSVAVDIIATLFARRRQDTVR